MLTYRDAMLRHQMMLERVKGFYYREFNAVMKAFEKDVRRLISEQAPDNMAELSPAKRRALIRAIKERQQVLFEGWANVFTKDNRRLAAVDRTLAARILEATQVSETKRAAASFLRSADSLDNLWASILAEPIGANGETMEEMLETFVNSSVKKVSLELAKATVNETSKAETITAIVGPRNKNEGVFRLIRANSRAVIATVMQHTSTSTHRNVQAASYETYRWISVLDERTTEICRGRHNKVFEYSTGPKPPAHFNCRSTIAPNVSGAEDDALSDGDEWLARQLASTVTAMLGAKIENKSVADLMRSAHERPMTIEKLAASADILTRSN